MKTIHALTLAFAFAAMSLAGCATASKKAGCCPAGTDGICSVSGRPCTSCCATTGQCADKKP